MRLLQAFVSIGGSGGIRTPESLATLPAFKAGPINRALARFQCSILSHYTLKFNLFFGKLILSRCTILKYTIRHLNCGLKEKHIRKLAVHWVLQKALYIIGYNFYLFQKIADQQQERHIFWNESNGLARQQIIKRSWQCSNVSNGSRRECSTNPR